MVTASDPKASSQSVSTARWSTPTQGDRAPRLHFFGRGDLATYIQVQHAAAVLRTSDLTTAPEDVNDVLELHNAVLFVGGGFVADDVTDADRTRLVALADMVKRVIADWFAAVTDANVVELLHGLDWEYREQILDLLARFGVFSRCSEAAMLPALDAAGVRLGDMLTSKRLVAAYGDGIRDRLIADTANAELVVRHHLQERAGNRMFFPPMFTPHDSRALMDRYLDSSGPNTSHVKLIANAPVDTRSGIDAKLKVKAQRRYDMQVEELFKNAEGIKTGCSVIISESQSEFEPIITTMDELVMEFSFSQTWLDVTLDFPSVLNNFQFLFEFAPIHGLLTLPSFDSELGTLERVIGLKGVSDYRTGHAFTAKDRASFCQTTMYLRFLGSKDIDLEEVIKWYFQDHVRAEYGIEGLVYTPSSRTANYLERCRNLFAEMESIATQFRLFVEDGKIDHDVAAAGTDQVRYKTIESTLDGKYVYVSNNADMQIIQRALFSDQSHITWINNDLHARTGAELLNGHTVPHAALLAHQLPLVDHLIELGVLTDTGTRVQLASPELFLVLKLLNEFEAIGFYHLNSDARTCVDAMEAKGWVERRSTMLTETEANYFNYWLNTVEFNNGPKIRNKYQHGTQVKVGEGQHYTTYIQAMRLMIALIIKINDELELRSRIQSAASIAAAI